jgi:hypothetical protein
MRGGMLAVMTRNRSASSRKMRWLLVVAGIVVAGLTASIGAAANYTTYYCGDALNYCTVYSDAPKTTASVALRDSNIITCKFGCHTRVYYYSAGTGSFGVMHTNGNCCAYYLIGSGSNYVYSRCITDAGYGSNTARCWTDWHT